MKIALLCGGPSQERGISLNSARSVLDHLGGDGIEIVPIYFDYQKKPYQLSIYQLYSNTPSDFDFKLHESASKLNEQELIKLLKSVDIAFPVMHGPFGEDGEIQAFLEKQRIPFIGSSSVACKKMFDKHKANQFIREQGFYALPSIVLKIYDHQNNQSKIKNFFKEHQLTRAIVKPASGGSSIGVYSVSSYEEAIEKMNHLFSRRLDTRVVVEPFCMGMEFTVIILQNRFGMPVAIMPTEIENNYENHQIFDYRKKYLPSGDVLYHCPPRFNNNIIEKIQVMAEQLFTVCGMSDFARFDGWLLPDGNIWFSDFNPVSGMEQNSFLFQQSSRIGFSHRDFFRFILSRACARQGIEMPRLLPVPTGKRKKVNVLFGGHTSERQVSLMSGSNVWLKLRRSKLYEPEPYLLDQNGDVWRLPYYLILNHTIEEIYSNCLNAISDQERLKFLEQKVLLRLALRDNENSESGFLPEKMTLDTFIDKSDFIFLALHGGDGENGNFQKQIALKGKKFNGPDEICSRICIDKFATGQALSALEKYGIYSAPKKSYKLKNLSVMNRDQIAEIWLTMCRDFKCKSLIVKPQNDGCSSGIVRLFSADDLYEYICLINNKSAFIPPFTFKNQPNIIEMPVNAPINLLFEKFIITDAIRIKSNSLKYTKKSGWVEMTIGVLQQGDRVKALNPSITVVEGDVLSVEEKFQGGTGINITPPPANILKPELLAKIKKSIEITAKILDIKGYSRIDIFANVDNADIIVIEVNTLPALTPSTVLYHQGLAENPPLNPIGLLEKIIQSADY